MAISLSVTINGVSRTPHLGSLEIIERVNERNRLVIEVFAFSGEFRPSQGEEIIVTESSVRIFGGHIEDVEEQLIGGETAGVGLLFRITAVDFNSLADRRYTVFGTTTSNTLKTVLTSLVTFLSPYGVTLDPAQVDGPTIPPFYYSMISITEMLNDLATMSTSLASQGYVWEIDYNKILRMFGVASLAAPFNITSTSAVIGDTSVKPSKTDYANFVNVLFGTGSVRVVDPVGTGNGILTTFPLHYYLAQHEGFVNVGGTVTNGVISGGVNETFGPNGSGATWTYDPTPYPSQIVRTSAPTGAILVPYIANFPSVVTATTGAAAADRVDRVYRYEDIFDYAQAQAIANGLLAQAGMTFKEVVYLIATSGCHPGMNQTIILSKHGLSGAHTITQVRVFDRVETQLWYEITAISGISATPESYTETYKVWNKGASGTSGSGTTIIVSGPQTKQSLFLGGNDLLYKQSPSPDWVAADGVRITIDTNIRGTLFGTVRSRLRAASGNVTARLRNITDSTTAGTSSVVSSSSWTDANFAVTLAAGIKVYELQLLPGTANVDVAGVGYFE